MKQKLEGVPETLLIPLWAKAIEIKQKQPIIRDDKAIEIMGKIDYDFSKFNDQWPTQISVVIRTEILDKVTKNFIDKYPDAVIINLGCGLDTRFLRLDNDKIQWYDLDLPEPIAIRRQFFKETTRYKMIAKDIFDFSWIDEIWQNDRILIIIEGVLMYFNEEEVKNLFNKLVNSFEGAEILLEVVPKSLINQNKKEDLIKNQYQINAQFKWGISNSKKLEKFNNKIKFIEEFHYFNYHKNRWRIIRWFSIIPGFKSSFGNRIVHLKFKKG